MTWKLTCPNNHEWESPKNKDKCPKCGKRNQEAKRGRLIAYDIYCEKCQETFRFERKEGVCTRCNSHSTKSKPIYDFS